MKSLRLLISIGLLFAITSTALAQSGGGYDLTWNVIAGGGAASTGSGYALMGTIGQAAAGQLMTGGNYALTGGFWANSTGQYQVFLPIMLK